MRKEAELAECGLGSTSKVMLADGAREASSPNAHLLLVLTRVAD